MKKLSPISGFLLTIFLLILSTFFWQSCSEKEKDNADIQKDSIISMMQNTQASLQAPGWIAGIKTPVKEYRLSGGMEVLGTDQSMAPNDLIRIGSITKTFTATLVLILCDEGVLHLNDKLDHYYPDFLNADKITIRMLLKHTSGMVTWDEDEEIRTQIFNGTGDWTIDKLIDWASSQPFYFEPGTGFHYSNIGYFLLGKIIEESTGHTVAELMNEKICSPLNLGHTFMALEANPLGETIHGYDASSGTVTDMTGTQQADAINFELAWTAGGMLSTIDDLSIWIRAVANGDLLSDSLHQKQMPVLSPPTQQNPYYSGYGMGISQTDVWLGHTGAVCGYICNMSFYPQGDVSIITFYNKFSVFDESINSSDLNNVASNFLEVARFLCPETLKP